MFCLCISILLEYIPSSLIQNNLPLFLAGHRYFFVNLFLGLFASCLVALITSIILFLQEFNQIVETIVTLISSLIKHIEELNSIREKYYRKPSIDDESIIEDDMDYVIDILELIKIDSNKLLLNTQLVCFITNAEQILPQLSLLNKKAYYYRYTLTKCNQTISYSIVNYVNYINNFEIGSSLENKIIEMTSYKKLSLLNKINLIKEFSLT